MNVKQLSIVTFLLLIISSNTYAHHKTINVALVSPNTDKNNFWRIVHDFAHASAKDLNINLKIYSRIENNFSYIDSLKSAFEANPKPDVVIGIVYKKLLTKTLDLSDKYDTPIFMFNTFVSDNEKNASLIRKEYKNYLGHMHPDEESAGYKLAKYLIKMQKEKNPDKEISVVGIAGHRNSFVTQLRNTGLQRAVKEEKAILHQIVNANWSADISYKQASGLIGRYSDLDVIWSASDLMAINSKKAIKNKQKHEIVTGGIDWTKEGVEKVKNGELQASVGGHFSEIGFALVLIHDYFHGEDFYDELGGEIITEMTLLSSENLNQYYDFLNTQDWDRINFSDFSKVLNPKVDEYSFSFQSLLDNYKNNN